MKAWRGVSLACALLLLLGLTVVAHKVRQGEGARRTDTEDSRRQLTESLRTVVPLPSGNAVSKRDTLCVTGVDSFVVTLFRHQLFDGKKQAARSQRLRSLSQQAVFAERYAELAHPAPTLPKRLGSVRDGNGRRPIEPPTVACTNTAFAEFPLPPTTAVNVDKSTTP